MKRAKYSRVRGRRLLQPLVNNTDPMSLMQVAWGANGTDGLVESLEVGRQVNPVGYNGDTATHLFSFLTNDGYTSSSCYNQDYAMRGLTHDLRPRPSEGNG
jgi:hypothetical protein